MARTMFYMLFGNRSFFYAAFWYVMQPTSTAHGHLTYISIGHPWIPFYFRSILVAGPTFFLRTIPSPAYSSGRIFLRGALVSPAEPAATACAAVHLDPVGSRSCRPTGDIALEKSQLESHNCHRRGSAWVCCSRGCGRGSPMALPSWPVYVPLHAVFGLVDFTSLYGCVVVNIGFFEYERKARLGWLYGCSYWSLGDDNHVRSNQGSRRVHEKVAPEGGSLRRGTHSGYGVGGGAIWYGFLPIG